MATLPAESSIGEERGADAHPWIDTVFTGTRGRGRHARCFPYERCIQTLFLPRKRRFLVSWFLDTRRWLP